MRSIVLFIVLASSSLAAAAEGVLEINQTCAVQTGCVPGDVAGFPVTISSPGRYRLTSSLLGPIDGPTIDITASGVELDLNGQSLSVDGSPYIRSSDSGIQGAIAARHVTVRDGHIANGGVDLAGSGAVLSKIRSDVFVSCGADCLVDESRITPRYDEDAMSCGAGCRVVDSLVAGDEGGLTCGDACTIERSIIRGEDGNPPLAAGHQSRIVDSTIDGSLIGTPSTCGDHCLVRDTTFNGSDFGPPLTTGRASRLQGVVARPGAMSVGDASSISHSVIDVGPNGGTIAISVSSGTARYSDTVLQTTTGPPTASGAVIDAGGNVCNGTTSCP